MDKTVVILFAGTILTMGVFALLDRPMHGQPSGNNLQHISDPAKVATIMSGWKQSGTFGYAVASVVVDTLVFIPFYSLLFFVLLSRLPQLAFSRFAFAALLAGMFDLAENAGIFTEMAATRTRRRSRTACRSRSGSCSPASF
ncbi:MAG TPA: hypothetical protein VF381_11940 [Thermoanaerobaculia bacterium]